MVSPVAGRQLEVCGLESSPRSTSTLLASMARNCGAKPWSDATKVVGSLPIRRAGEGQGRVGALVGAADEAFALGDAAVRRPVDLDVVVGRVRARRSGASARRGPGTGAGTRRSSGSRRAAGRACTSARRTAASAGGPSPSRGPARRTSPRDTIPASRTAKSAAVEVGNFWARYSSKEPLKPGSPGQPAQVAFARPTEVWKRRTFERSAVSSSTLTSMPAVWPARAPPWIVTLTSAHWPFARVPTASGAAPLFVFEKRTGRSRPCCCSCCRRGTR